MKIVLVRPKYNTHVITPPLGLGYLASYLKQHHIPVKIIDALRDNCHTHSLLKEIQAEKPDAVGITCLTDFYPQVVRLSQSLKKRGFKCIIGGVHPTFLPYQTLKQSKADFVVCGQGEIALRKLVKAKFVDQNIPGVYSLKNLRKNTRISKAQVIKNLDNLPFPDWEQLNPRTYSTAPHGAFVKNFPIGSIMTTRGCPYKCSFCASKNFYDRTIKYRSTNNIIQEIKYLINHFGVKEIHFEDDNLTLKRNHIEKLCQAIIKHKLNISWTCPNGIRADRVDEPLLRLMKKSGCYLIAFGIESANPQILKNIHKLETLADIKKAIQLTHKVGILSQGFFIFGLPGDTKQTMENSIRFAKQTKLARVHFGTLQILPGTEFWQKYPPNWTPKGLSKKTLLKTQTRAFKQFYLRPLILLKLIQFIKPQQLKLLFKRLKDYQLLSLS
jgi:anaerobic magnesium-protoporphyrin IX monomethyl ester cyclase